MTQTPENIEKLREALEWTQSVFSGPNCRTPETQKAVFILMDAARAHLSALTAQASGMDQHFTIEHDGFAGTVIGSYTTKEGKEGVVMQQDGTRVVHVYGKKWIKAAPTITAKSENEDV